MQLCFPILGNLLFCDLSSLWAIYVYCVTYILLLGMTRIGNWFGRTKPLTIMDQQLLTILTLPEPHRIGIGSVEMTGFLEQFYLLGKGFSEG